MEELDKKVEELDQKLMDIRGIARTAKELNVFFTTAPLYDGAALEVELRGNACCMPKNIATYVADILNQALEPIIQDLRLSLQEEAVSKLRKLLHTLEPQTITERPEIVESSK